MDQKIKPFLRFMLAIALFFGAASQALAGVPTSGAQPCLDCGTSFSMQASVQSHLTTLYSYLKECPNVPREVTEFYPGDETTAWNYTTNCNSGDNYQWIWIAPDGRTSRGDVHNVSKTTNWCFWSYWPDGIPDNPGSWQVKFYYNGSLKYTDYFTVLSSSQEWNAVYNEIFANNKQSNLELLRKFRDEVLLESELGQEYVYRLYDRSHEVALILLLNPEILAQARAVVDQLLPKVRDVLQGGTGYLPQQLGQDISTLLDAMHAQAGPKLQLLIQDVQQALQDHELLD